MSTLEQRLREAFNAAREATDSNPDLFERVQRSVDDSRLRRRWRWAVSRNVLVFVGGLVALSLIFGNYEQGGFSMSWWLIELLTNIVLVAIAVVLGPFIKRFGRSYAADVFRANPRTGKSYLVLTDVAYYLIFTAFVLFNISFKDRWPDRADQWKTEVVRVGGILLIMGVLHAANVVALPIIGQLLSSRGLEGPGSSPQANRNPTLTPPIGPGTWILRVEAADPQLPPPTQPVQPPGPPT
jgi:hypothetical protein